ncbi:MBL fold metallo-hydrolase [Crossiella cryophila]|uniref:Glyoxylase-like metal-dependent hydrolase (Beta-lactamase superfamily II) n=1 Tax=Crossiella cryophila TaxID=43355 RepID=A0A7W7FVT0_9PSEU|nr:MBL fold metallo-hydrolase [Crossiella cryophila]MBB4680796.1 glyoxylase-like metal-dependent hydrolase (beta-lactamase superfamily II) [Crossiella cryophila]
MDTTPLLPNLTQLTFPVGQAYLWHDATEATLIDTGLPGYGDQVCEAVTGLGVPLRRIVLTHWHADHTGAAAEIVSWSNAEVIAHHADAPMIRGEAVGQPPVFEADWERELHGQISPGVPAHPPCRVDREVEDGEVLAFGGGARVIGAPGHTPGSIAVWLPSGVLFLGDAVVNVTELSVGVFNVDSELARKSFARLSELDFEIACFGHGPALLTNAGTRFRELAATLPT